MWLLLCHRINLPGLTGPFLVFWSSVLLCGFESQSLFVSTTPELRPTNRGQITFSDTFPPHSVGFSMTELDKGDQEFSSCILCRVLLCCLPRGNDRRTACENIGRNTLVVLKASCISRVSGAPFCRVSGFTWSLQRVPVGAAATLPDHLCFGL